MAHRAKVSAHVMRRRLIEAKRWLISLEEWLISLAHSRMEREEWLNGVKNS
jgi:hypothetical protein